MKKTISIDVCDVCEEQIDEKPNKCELCGKEFCDDCGDIIFEDDQQVVHIMKMKVCHSCFDDHFDENLDDIISKFFRQKEIKEQLKTLRSKMKDYLKNIVILRNLGDKKDE